jgi:hypothetical protein
MSGPIPAHMLFVSAAPALFQYATHDDFVSVASAKHYFDISSGPKEIKFYESSHALNADARRIKLTIFEGIFLYPRWLRRFWRRSRNEMIFDCDASIASGCSFCISPVQLLNKRKPQIGALIACGGLDIPLRSRFKRT